MAVDYTALWDEIYTLLSTDVTLISIIGTADNIGRGFAPTQYDMSSSNVVVLIGDADTDTLHYQVDDGSMLISTWCAEGSQEKIVLSLDRIAALLDGYDPTVTWCQQITKRGRMAVTFDQTDKLHFGRDSYKIPHRRI